jgi:hypothetical protein
MSVFKHSDSGFTQHLATAALWLAPYLVLHSIGRQLNYTFCLGGGGSEKNKRHKKKIPQQAEELGHF